MGYGESLDAALSDLVGRSEGRDTDPAAPAGPSDDALGDARDALRAYLEAMGSRRFEGAADALRELSETLSTTTSETHREAP